MVIDKDVKSSGCDSYRVEHLPNLQNLHKFTEFPTSLSCGKTSNGLASQDIGVLSVTPDPKLENLTVFQHPNQFTEIPSSSCATSSNRFASQASDANQDPHFLMSASSCNQKKRRMKISHSTNLSFDESPAQFKHSFEDNEKVKLGLLKSQNQNTPFPSSDLSNEIELHVCCSSCRNPLGLAENRFLLKNLMILTSKVYLSYIRIYGAEASFMPECLSTTPPTVINVLISEIKFINALIIKGHVKKNFSNYGVWCEEDGCVFRAIFCPFCKDCDTCLGVHVLATDASNVSLLNKVLFYADCLCISEPKTFDETALPINENLLSKSSDDAENEKYILKIPLDEPSYDPNQNQSLPVENEKYGCKAVNKKPDNLLPKPLEIEKFAYQPQTKPPCNIKIVPDQTEKFAYWSQPKASHSVITAKSKLKLPRRQ